MLPFCDKIRPAHIDDAQLIYSLLQEAFGESYLKFTIYQTPKAEKYIGELIHRGQQSDSLSTYVVEDTGLLLGFYLAIRRSEELFLNYIATSMQARGQGVGRLLLLHFEFAARKRGCLKTGLEVFKSNFKAVDWYRRAGYCLSSCRYHARINIKAYRSGHGPNLDFRQAELEQALIREENAGFSNFHCSVAGKRILLGLIGGDVCNVLEPIDFSLIDVAKAIGRSAIGSRAWLLVHTAEPINEYDGLESVETALYMNKNLL